MNFRADIYAGERLAVVRYYEADTLDAALAAAQRDVVALGHDHADVWEDDGIGGAAYVDTVGAER